MLTILRSRPVAGAIFAAGLVCIAVIARGEPRPMQQCSPANCQNSTVNVTGPVLQPLMNHVGTCRTDGLLENSTVTEGAFVKQSTTINKARRPP